jgi:hypothetical protein
MACNRRYLRPRYGFWAATLALACPALACPALAGAATPAPGPPIVRIGAAYVAKQLCSCLFVAQRAETPCRAEFKPEIDTFTVVIDRTGMPGGGRVTASVGPVVAEATYAAPFGCVIAK